LHRKRKEQHVDYGFTKLKLAIAHGPADGREGRKKNLELVKRGRQAVGHDGEIMLDCWMAWTERYTIEMADMLAPYRVYWMEEVLPPYDYAGFGRLNTALKSTRIPTGEHEYGRYGFRYLLEHNSASIWQPDLNWCGALTELRWIGALAAAYVWYVVKDCAASVGIKELAPQPEENLRDRGFRARAILHSNKGRRQATVRSQAELI
jgi:L-rhamnonate dehydratase